MNAARRNTTDVSASHGRSLVSCTFIRLYAVAAAAAAVADAACIIHPRLCDAVGDDTRWLSARRSPVMTAG